MHETLRKGEWQYGMYKRNAELINRKCHDLKHEIAVLRGISESTERESYIAELENAIRFYDTKIKTGNEVVDILLSEKSLRCREGDIEFSCIVDGRALDFMTPVDLSVLFGNALDNAIASVIREPEEKRIISLNVAGQQDMLFIHMENECSDELHFEDGLPVTTKEDKRFHGFGTRSIRYIAQKYGGEAEMSYQNGKFILDILF